MRWCSQSVEVRGKRSVRGDNQIDGVASIRMRMPVGLQLQSGYALPVAIATKVSRLPKSVLATDARSRKSVSRGQGGIYQ